VVGSLGTLEKAQNVGLIVRGVSLIIGPPMRKTAKRFSALYVVQMNRRGAISDQAIRHLPHLLAASAAVLFMVAAARATDLPPVAAPVSAERLVIQYKSGSYQLLSRTPLLKVLPPSDELPATNRAVSGFWFEVQTPKQKVIYRRIIPDPIKVYTEVPGPAPEPRPERAEAVRTEVVFTVLIPQVPGSNNLVLVSSPPGAAGNAPAAQPLARIPLAERPK
jgi:hypothetical protein